MVNLRSPTQWIVATVSFWSFFFIIAFLTSNVFNCYFSNRFSSVLTRSISILPLYTHAISQFPLLVLSLMFWNLSGRRLRPTSLLSECSGPDHACTGQTHFHGISVFQLPFRLSFLPEAVLRLNSFPCSTPINALFGRGRDKMAKWDLNVWNIMLLLKLAHAKCQRLRNIVVSYRNDLKSDFAYFIAIF